MRSNLDQNDTENLTEAATNDFRQIGRPPQIQAPDSGLMIVHADSSIAYIFEYI